MDYEKKYKEALERARELIGKWIGKNKNFYIEDYSYIFPELKESEDEKIRKEIIKLVNFFYGSSAVFKQTVSKDEMIAWLEKQGEQKPADEVEPKFKVGDWVVNNDGSPFSCGENTLQITDIEGEEIWLESKTWTTGESIHLWTIADAKDGDVLSNGEMIVIFKHFEEPSYRQRIVAYIGLDSGGDIQITDDTWKLGIDKAKPATKEQRDLLFQKMKEAGYEWDAEKLELRKKEPEFKPFDKVLVRDGIDDIWRLAQYGFESKDKTYNTVGGTWWAYCIPYEGNEHLLGTIEKS